MDMSFVVLRTAKLKSLGNIGGSLSHAYRTIKTPNADPSRTHLNDNSLATKEQAFQAIKDRLPTKVKPDNVLCVEYLITASNDWSGWGTDKQQKYFDDAIQWLKDRHGSDNVVVTSIQLDETTPHLSAYVVPLDKDKKGRDILNAKKFLGGRQKLSDMQSDFFEKVGSKVGLERGVQGSKAKHTTIKKFYTGLQNPTPIKIPKAKWNELTFQYQARIEGQVNDYATQLRNGVKVYKDKFNKLNQQYAKLAQDTEPYRKAKSRLNGDMKVEFDRQVTSLGKSLHQQQEQQYERELAERNRRLAEVERNRLKSLGVDKIAQMGEVYRGKVVKVNEHGAYQQTADGMVLHPSYKNRPTDFEQGKVYTLDYKTNQAKGEVLKSQDYDLSRYGKGQSRSEQMDLG